MTKKRDKEKTVEEVATMPEPGLFVSRISTEMITIRGTTFTINSIPKNVKRYAMSKFKNLASASHVTKTLEFVTLIFRLGCSDIVGLKDSDGNDVKIKFDTIKIDGADRKMIAEFVVEGLPDELVSTLGARVLTINSLSDGELDKLDFTKNSEGTKPNV